jgi:hypothetical protein
MDPTLFRDWKFGQLSVFLQQNLMLQWKMCILISASDFMNEEMILVALSRPSRGCCCGL